VTIKHSTFEKLYETNPKVLTHEIPKLTNYTTWVWYNRGKCHVILEFATV